MIKNKKSSKKKIIVSILLGLIVLGTTGLVLEFTGVIDIYHKKPSDQDTTENGINYGPPTEEEKRAGDDIKPQLPDDTNQPTEQTQNANVVIVDASQYDNEIEVRAFVSNLVKDGICKITFTKGSLKIEKQANAYADASSTPCTNLVVPRSEFSELGSWAVKVEYLSAGSYGKAEQPIEIK